MAPPRLRNSDMGVRLIYSLAILGLLAIWEGACRLGVVNPIILAPPSGIALAAWTDGAQFLQALRTTAGGIALAVAASWSIGVGIGLAIGASRLSFVAFGAILSSLFAIPLIVWYPMFVVWAGIGSESKVLFGIVTGTLPVALNTAAGIRLIDQRFVPFGRSIGAGALTIYLRIVLPFALPAVVSGLRIGTALAVSSVIVGEMLASTDGVGFWISYHRTLYNTGHVYFGMLLAVACVLAVNAVLAGLEDRLGSWRREERRAAMSQ